MAAPPGEYVTAGANPSRTGEVVDQALFGPLTRAWSVQLGRPYSGQPLVAEGRVLVNKGVNLIALEPISGRELWRQEVTGIIGAGAGIVVSVQGNELVSAFSIGDGQLRWTRQFADTSQGAAPIIAGGVVYVALPEHSGSEGRLHALSAADGSTLWSVRAAGAGGQPAIDSRRIFVSGDCGNTVAYSRNDGSELWRADVADFTCFDGIASLYDGTLYAGSGYVFDPVSGAQRPQLEDAQKPDAFSARLGFGGDGSEVKAVALDSGDRRWRRAKGDRPEYQGPLVVGGTVHVTETAPSGRRNLLGLERSSGRALWTARVPRFADGEGGLAAGSGHLFVANGEWLTAFTPVLKPGPRGADIGASAYDVTIGKPVAFVGGTGHELRDAVPELQLAADRFPYKRERARDRAQVREDGAAYFRTPVKRNTRFRIRVPGGPESERVVVYAYPRFRFRFDAISRRQGLAIVTVKRARSTAVKGKRLFVYLNRDGGGGLLKRLGSARLRAVGDRTARAGARFRRLKRLGPRDTIVACVKRLARAGYGRNDGFARACGQPRIRLSSKAGKATTTNALRQTEVRAGATLSRRTSNKVR